MKRITRKFLKGLVVDGVTFEYYNGNYWQTIKGYGVNSVSQFYLPRERYRIADDVISYHDRPDLFLQRIRILPLLGFEITVHWNDYCIQFAEQPIPEEQEKTTLCWLRIDRLYPTHDHVGLKYEKYADCPACIEARQRQERTETTALRRDFNNEKTGAG